MHGASWSFAQADSALQSQRHARYGRPAGYAHTTDQAWIEGALFVFDALVV